ncbi:hypothetical protein DAPPUDRAFT_110232 [Daphnia pulex]|uniref:Uncharacterized protein n=1 Tax=Daphnia pulex TaxID=6669 RepID=E9H5E2_DAPPU|nr:hypothetical protein DAPPUDRAFT_110232 [Daphnia pulex]|eukprot:EFX73017.1 hypothetical protein DAPPUDRAFT_110232 [Daphnia pulex]
METGETSTSATPGVASAFSSAYQQMKIAVIVLSVLVVFTHQQFYHHQPSTAAERLFWLSRYYSPRPSFDYYNHQPVNYADNQGEDDDSFHPLMPSAFSQKARPYLNAIGNPNDEEEENQFPVQVQGRRKTMNSFPTRFRPSFLQSKPQQQDDPRFLINLASPNLITRKVKTITFTLTSSLTFTSVQSCIPSAQFYTGAADVACRRKRRGGIVAPLTISKPADTQFAITPTDVQP